MSNCILALICVLYSTAFSQQGYNPSYVYNAQDSLIWQAIVQVDAEQFDSALVLFHRVIEADTASPKGYFFTAAIYSNLTTDYRKFGLKSEFYKHVDKAIGIGELKDEGGRATAEDLFYYGGAVGYRGIFRSFDGDWWGAFKDGLRGRGLLSRAFEADSSYMDIYLGLGSYNYWRSAKTKVLWWLPFFSDKRALGIEEIKKAIKYGKFASHEGKYALMRIYCDYGKYDMAVEHWNQNVKQLNPADPFSHYWLGLSYIGNSNYEKALISFETILSVYIRSPYYDPGGEMECRYYIGLCRHKLGDLEQAVKQLRLASLIAEQLPERKDLQEVLPLISPLLETVEKELDRK